MEINKCCRCGAFFVSEGNVCPKCGPKDALELSTLKNYIEKNGFTSIDSLSVGTGISSKNLNRYFSTDDIENYLQDNTSKNFIKNML